MAVRLVETVYTRSDTTDVIRSWAGALSALLLSAGWVRTSDSGQTAAASLPACSAVWQFAGYEIWRMDDSLQSTAPCVIKLSYGCAGHMNLARLEMTVGTGSDGAGNITGILGVASAYLTGTGTGAGASFWGSAGPGRFCFFVGSTSAASGHFMMSIERIRDSAGDVTGDGFLVFGAGIDESLVIGVQTFQVLSPQLSYPNSTRMGIFTPSGVTWAGSANDVGVCPVRFFHGRPSNPSVQWVAYLNGDIPVDSYPMVSLYGVSRRYFAIGSSRLSTADGLNAACTLMLLWE